ncbi:MAG: histidine kinase, partial [Candidatus Desantisbacteria bacterium]
MWSGIFLCLILNFCLILNCGLADAENHCLHLAGKHKFSPGDNPLWSSPKYDDSDWKLINLPGSWQSQGVKPKDGIGWYRIHFTLTDRFKNIQQPAVSLGRIGNADEVFLNGRKIGSEGIVDGKFIEAGKVERLYSLPRNLLKFDGSNLLTVRVINVYSEGGILAGNIALGNYDSLLIEKLKRDNIRKIVEGVFFAFIAIYFLFCLFVLINGVREREWIFFGLFLFMCEITSVLDSLIFYETGLKTPFIQQIIHCLISLLPGVVLLFLVSVYKDRFNLLLKFSLFFCLLLSMFALFFSTHSYRACSFFNLIWIYEMFLVEGASLFLVIRAYLRKDYESAPILFGVMGAFLITVAEIVGFSKYFYGLYPSDFAGIFFMMSIKYALITRYVRLQNSMKVLSEKILIAHEDERKRLSREIHDGIGQSLLAIKLNLQMMEEKVKKKISIRKEIFPELILEVSSSIKELREMAMNLRPSFLEEMSISDAIRWFSKKIQENSGIEIRVQAQDSIKVSPVIKDNIFRIYQEALNNVLKHSGADCVQVMLNQSKGKEILVSLKNDRQLVGTLLAFDIHVNIVLDNAKELHGG